MSKHIYLDYNASAPVRAEVKEAVIKALDISGNPSSVHAEGRGARMLIDEARKSVANLFDVKSEQVIFTSGGTESNNMALYGLLKACSKKDSKLVVSSVEHSSVLKASKAIAEANNSEVIVIPVDKNGYVDLDTLDATLAKNNVAVVSVMHANNETGTIQPVKQIAEICKKYNVPFHCDAVQSAGKLKYTFKDLNCDFASFSFHKMGATKGVGALITSGKYAIENLMSGGSQEKSRRGGTENLTGIVAAGVAASLAEKSAEDMLFKISKLRDYLESSLKEISADIIIVGEGSERVDNTCNFITPGMSGQAMVMSLDIKGISTSQGSACYSGVVKPSHVLMAYGFSEDLASSSLRISLGPNTTKEDIDTFIKEFKQLYLRHKEMVA